MPILQPAIDAWRAAVRIPERTDVSTWARNSIVLSPRVPTPFHGPYRVENSAYIGWKGGLFDLWNDPDTYHIVVRKGAQTGFTQAAFVLLCNAAAVDPGPALYVMPSQDMARTRNRGTFKPMIEDSPAMRETITDSRDITTDSVRFKLMDLDFIGSNSPGQLASRPVRYLILDEGDKFQRSPKEAAPRDLAIQRTKQYVHNRKVLEFCTPTLEHFGINVAYLSGDRRVPIVPCLSCGAEIQLTFKAIKYDKRKDPEQCASEARIVCPSCGHEHDTRAKDRMVSRPECYWRPTAKTTVPGLASMWAPSILSRAVSIEDLVRKFENARGDALALRDVVNSEFGEPWIGSTSDDIRESLLDERRAGYMAAHGNLMACPDVSAWGLDYVDIVSADVQHDRLPYIMRRFWRAGQSALLAHGYAVDYAELDSLGDGGRKADFVFIDSGDGNKTHEVYVASEKYNFIPVKGASKRCDFLCRAGKADFRTGKRGADGLDLLSVDTVQSKTILFERIRGNGPPWLLPLDISEAYKKQLVSERYDRESDRYVLRPGFRQNHWLDCEANAIACASVAGIEIAEA